MIPDYHQGLYGDDLVRAVAEDFFSSISILRHQLNGLERFIMIDLDQVLSEVQSQGSLVTELSTLVATLHQHAVDHADGKVVPPVVQDKIDKLMAVIVANRTTMADAMKLAATANAAFEAMKAPNLA